jgi:hypothetical protein
MACALIAVLSAAPAVAGVMLADERVLNPSISADGKILACDSCSSNWAGSYYYSKVFIYHRERHKVLNICRNGPYTANGSCDTAMVSADGKQVVYVSGADNLIGGINTNYFITNNTCNILACEIEEGDFSSPAPGFTHKLVSVAASGAQPNQGCFYPVCSSNARYVAFWTKTNNLDPDTVDTNYDEDYTYWQYIGGDIYLRDRDLDGNGVFDEEGAGKTKTTRVSHDSDLGMWHQAWWGGLSISADGQYVTYSLTASSAPLGRGLAMCVYRVADGMVQVYRPASYMYEYGSGISPDGGYLVTAYDSTYGGGYYRTILYALPNTNWWYAAVPMNTSTGVCVGGMALSTGAHYMAFYSGSTNFVTGDSNRKYDVFVRVATGDPRSVERYELISKSTAGELGNGDSDDSYCDRAIAMTPDGRYVAYVSAASNLVAGDTNGCEDVFIRDRLSNTTEIVAQKTGDPVFPAGAALTVSQVGDTSASFQWTAATDDYPIWEYQLNLASDSGSSTQLTLSGESTSYSATGLEPGSQYTATLSAYDGGGNHSDALSNSFTTTGQSTNFGPRIAANGIRGAVTLKSTPKLVRDVAGISAHGAKGEVILTNGAPVTITVWIKSMDAYLDAPIDWWVIAYARSGAWYYLDSSGQWLPFSGDLSACHPAYQGGLFNLTSTPVLSDYVLPVGTFDFWFAIDYPMDGYLDTGGQLLYDKVTVNVQ